MPGLTLFTYFRSSAAYRVRIALNLKGLHYEPHFIHLLKGGGEQHQQAYLDLNPQGLIPALATDDTLITQSLAVLEYLDETYPQAPLLPSQPQARAFVRSLALMVCCDIHPLNNLRVHGYLDKVLHVDAEARRRWYQHWIYEGLAALEQRIAAQAHDDDFCYGAAPTMADVCLIPQIYNAKRFDCDLDDYPALCRIYDHCMTLDAFIAAAPENQPDSE